jgi:putative acetyltransferase
LINVNCRLESIEDLQSIWLVNQTAFEGDAEANLVDALRDGDFVDISIVAVVDGKVVGHILFSRVAIASKVGTVDALSLAPMTVLSIHQRQGFGTKLVESGLAASREQAHRIAVVLGHLKFYPRFGFSAELAQQIESPFGEGEAWVALDLSQGTLAGTKGRGEYSPPFMVSE